ncbi:MAG: hypothetical protein SVY53_14620 [Chloroflexota bacterium]|nr:hypothetical protein [Chloroflexota bacterium]
MKAYGLIRRNCIISGSWGVFQRKLAMIRMAAMDQCRMDCGRIIVGMYG